MLKILRIGFVFLALLVILPIHAQAAIPLFGANCLHQDPGINQITWLKANGVVAWKTDGSPSLYAINIVDTGDRTTIRRILSLSGRSTWVGYQAGGWDIDAQTLALHPYRYYRLLDKDGNTRYDLQMSGPFNEDVYINVFTHYNFIVRTGTPPGNHPCNAIAVPLRVIEDIER